MATPAASGKWNRSLPSRLALRVESKAGEGEGRRGRLEFSLPSRSRAVLFLLAVFAPGTWLIAVAGRVGLAAAWGESLELPRLQRAAALDTANPDLRFHLGTAYLWAEGGNPRAAVQQLREATRLNPRVAAYWSALAKSCYAAGEPGCADQAFARATQLSPATPRLAWEAALHYTVTNRPQAAWPHLRRLLRLQPSHAPQVFDLLLGSGADPEPVWRNVVSSADVGVRLSLLSFLASHSQVSATTQFWNELASGTPIVPRTPAIGYVETLLRKGCYGAASQVWANLLSTGVVLSPARSGTNLVFNGGFEQPPLGAGFDWHVQPQKYVAIDFASPGARHSTQALRLYFTVPDNSEYEPAYQFVPVTPGQRYLLSAYMRSDSLTSDSGPRLRVEDPQCEACLNIATASSLGTQPWHEVSATFTAPPAGEVVRLSLWRPRSRSFPMEISGQFWLDEVSVRALPAVEIGSAAGGPQP